MIKYKKDIKSIILYIIFFIGVAVIIREYIGGRSFHADEAMLALNMGRSFRELLLPLTYNQTAPILFLYLSKVFTLLFGISDYSLRALPLISGIGSLYIFLLLSKKAFDKNIAIISVTLFILSEKLIYYTNEFKQYSIEVFFSVLFLYFFITVHKEGIDLKKSIIIGSVGLIAIWFSYSTIVVLIAFITILFFNFIKKRNKKGIIITCVTGVLWFINIFLEYILIYRRDATYQFQPLLDYWSDSFMPFPPNNMSEILWLPRTLKDFFIYITGSDFYLFPIVKEIFAYLFIALFIAGIVASFKVKKGYLSVFVLTILFFSFFASALRIFPFGNRLTLYIAPLILVICALGIYSVINYLKKYHIILPIIFLILIFFLPTIPRVYHLIEPTYKSEIKSVVNYYMENREKNDKIYIEDNIYTYYFPQFYFYSDADFDFTNKGKDFHILKKEILTNERVWVIGEIGKLEKYGQLIDSYSIKTLASRWPFELFRDRIIYLNYPNATIDLYNFKQTGLESFMTRFYDEFLGRKPGDKELKQWSKSLLSNEKTVLDMVNFHIQSNEFEYSIYSNEVFIDKLYKVFFDREPDEQGMKYWLHTLKEGEKRESVLESFIGSFEFKALCSEYSDIEPE